MDQLEMPQENERNDTATAASALEHPEDAGGAIAVAPPPPPTAAIGGTPSGADVLTGDEPALEVVGHVETAPEVEAGDETAPMPRWSYARPRTPAHFLTVPSLGPVGRRRHPLLVFALCVITLGGYAVAWHRRINREASDFDARIDVAPGASALAIFMPWWAAFAATLTGAALLGLQQFHHPVSGVSTTVAWALLPAVLVVSDLILLFPLSLVATVMSLERIRGLEDRVGIEHDHQIRPVARLAVLGIPFLGLIWHVMSTQRRLNAIWTTVEPRVAGPRL
ncbi:MAG: hypothetical protein ACR2GX_03530 [Candidatus Dormibacteria bacterium]